MGAQGGGKQFSENVEQNCTEHGNEFSSGAEPISGVNSSKKTLPSPSQRTCSSDSTFKSSNSKNHKDLPSRTCDNGRRSKKSSSSSSSESETEEPSLKKKRKCDQSCSGNDSGPSLAKKAKLKSNEKEDEPYVPSTTKFVKVQQALLFNQENSVHIPHSFFQLVKEAGRSGQSLNGLLLHKQFWTTKF